MKLITSAKVLLADSLFSSKTFLPKALPIFKANFRKCSDLKKLMTHKIKRLSEKVYLCEVLLLLLLYHVLLHLGNSEKDSK